YAAPPVAPVIDRGDDVAALGQRLDERRIVRSRHAQRGQHEHGRAWTRAIVPLDRDALAVRALDDHFARQRWYIASDWSAVVQLVSHTSAVLFFWHVLRQPSRKLFGYDSQNPSSKPFFIPVKTSPQ